MLALPVCAQDGEMIWDGTAWVPAPAPEPGTPEADLVVIREMLDRGESPKAVLRAVEQFRATHHESPGCEEAMNLAGQSLLNDGEYWKAYDWFERQISNYPNGAFFERALDREFTIADAFLKGRKRKVWKVFRLPAKEDGVDMLLRIAAHAPGTDIAERSLLRVGDYYFEDQAWAEAMDVYDQFVRDNPYSARRPYAMLQAARSQFLSFRGIRWDVTPLREAMARYRVFAAAYPRQAKEENVADILREIQETLSHKLYETGAFYERTKYPAAAVYYYRQAVDSYPDTEWAKASASRLEVLGPIPSPHEAPPLPDLRPAADPALDVAVGPAPPADAPPATQDQQPTVKPIRLEDLRVPDAP
jgi:outer membrane protein assembly factor BamD (BamD/ComL family)